MLKTKTQLPALRGFKRILIVVKSVNIILTVSPYACLSTGIGM
jgi:hypothetical protein